MNGYLTRRIYQTDYSVAESDSVGIDKMVDVKNDIVQAEQRSKKKGAETFSNFAEQHRQRFQSPIPPTRGHNFIGSKISECRIAMRGCELGLRCTSGTKRHKCYSKFSHCTVLHLSSRFSRISLCVCSCPRLRGNFNATLFQIHKGSQSDPKPQQAFKLPESLQPLRGIFSVVLSMVPAPSSRTVRSFTQVSLTFITSASSTLTQM